MNLSVGQVIFLLTKKSSKVYPALVCEEIKKKSLDGETINYVVRLPTDGSQEVEIDKLDAEIFENIDAARKTIIGRISLQIDKMLDEAVKMSSVFSEFAIEQETQLDIPIPIISSDQDSNDEFALVDLGDGNVARLNIKDTNDIVGG